MNGGEDGYAKPIRPGEFHPPARIGLVFCEVNYDLAAGGRYKKL